jgi:hypothetical protein
VKLVILKLTIVKLLIVNLLIVKLLIVKLLIVKLKRIILPWIQRARQQSKYRHTLKIQVTEFKEKLIRFKQLLNHHNQLKMHFTGTIVLKVVNGNIIEEIALYDGVKALRQPGLLKPVE